MRLNIQFSPWATRFRLVTVTCLKTAIRALLLGSLCLLVSSCSTVQLAELTRGDHVASQVVRQAEILDHYHISRQLSYPLSKRATLFVNGEGAEIVASLTNALAVHFKAVQLRANQAPRQNSGFLLVVDKLGGSSLRSIAPAIQDRTPAEKLYDRLFTPTEAWSYQIKVVDIDSQTAFDHLTIRLKQQDWVESSERKGLLNSAFRHAAAKLAGQA